MASEQSNIVLRNDLAELERLGAFVASCAARFAWSRDVTDDLELALDEIVTNIISYAYDDDGLHEIGIRVVAATPVATIEIEDDGRLFDPTQAPSADTDGAIMERPVGGLGWHLVRRAVDGLSWRRDGDRNVVTISRRLGHEPGPVTS